jgi:hypothetical protein
VSKQGDIYRVAAGRIKRVEGKTGEPLTHWMPVARS